MSLHKARFKKLEELPNEKCCNERIKRLEKTAGIKIFTVDTSVKRIYTFTCDYCGTISQERLELWCVNEDGVGFIPAEALDIDEAPCPPSN